MKFSMPWRRKVNLKTLTLKQLKSRYPEVVEAICAEERVKLQKRIDQEQDNLREAQEGLKRIEKEASQQLTEAEKEQIFRLKAEKSRLVLQEQAWEHKELIKKN